jgi:MATE family multidrug resistance protein
MHRSFSSEKDMYMIVSNKTEEVKQTITLAIPIILGELAQMSLHLLDAAMVGALGYNHLAACGLVLSVINIPFVLAIGLTFSVSQLVSLAAGQHDKKLVSHYFYNGVLLCSFLGLILSLGLYFGVNILDYLKQDPEVVLLAKPFMKLMSISLFPMILFMTLKQFTDGLEFTKTAMILSFFALPINALLNFMLMFGYWGFPRLELVGAGYGTLITRILITLILAYIILYHKNFRKYVAVKSSQWKISWKAQKELLKIGIPSSMQVGMEASAFAISGIIIGMIGAKEQAAHQIALSIASFTFMVSMGLAHAGSIRTSNALGQRNNIKIRNIGISTIYAALIYGTFCLIVFMCFNNHLPKFFNDEVEVIEIAATLLFWAAIFQISDSVQAISAGLLRGIKDVKMPTVFIFIAYWVIGIPLGYYLAFYKGFGASGIWIGFILGLTTSAIFLSLRFLHLSKKQNISLS